MKAETISSTGGTAVPFAFRHSTRAEVTSIEHNSYTYTPHLHIHVGGNGGRNKWTISYIQRWNNQKSS